MTYFPSSYPVGAVPPGISPYSRVADSPFLQQAQYSSNPYGITAPPPTPVMSNLASQINGRGATSILNPSTMDDVLRPIAGAGAEVAPAAAMARTGGRNLLGLAGGSRGAAALGGRLGGMVKNFGPPIALTLAGQLAEQRFAPGSQGHSIGKGLSTAGVTTGVGSLASGLGLTVGGVGGAPIVIGAGAGGFAGGYINDRLAAHNVDFGPFHWGKEPHATPATLPDDPAIHHLIGEVAPQLLQSGEISSEDFTTIVNQAELAHSMGAAPEDIASQVAGMIQTATQLQPQRLAAEEEAALNSRRQLQEQVAIAKLMQETFGDQAQTDRAFADMVHAESGQMSGGMRPFADLIAGQTVQQGKSQRNAMIQSSLALPQIQSLMQAIQDQNALQQAANYQAAKDAQGSSSNPTLEELLAGAGGTSAP